MLETLHLTKVYKTKGGADVRALDDVSIQFPEKGMVFLLGKSGSGKSTLLNVCGGLDSPTSGSIIVKGRSSEQFSQSDFDSYRNTFVGFIFQEYNILSEFSVEDNIALALELQGKPKDKKVIADLLEQVDLTGFAKRKPNTLSGGQKQRIAIARALVKNPEIIMADEPTGALDSATGKQVFDTLKKLSKDKLVIIVSHDRDFAEMYADRIVELKDGKILSDVTKTQEQQQALTQNISIVGDTLCVKKGSDLSEQDFAEIKAFLAKTDRDVIIAGGERDVKTFKEAAHIKDNGEKEVFKDSSETPVEKINYSPEDSKFIRSKLPLKHAIKIGISGMRSKPIRLAFTIILCTVAFTMFGLLSTMMFYDSEATFKQTLVDSSQTTIKLGKVYSVKEIWHYAGETSEYEYARDTAFTKAELEEYQAVFGQDAFGSVSVWYTLGIQSKPSQYWINDIQNVAYLPENNSLRGLVNGEYPDAMDEICISTYMAQMLYTCKFSDPETGKSVELAAPEEVIGKEINIDATTYKIVGIIDSGMIPEKYEALKTSDGTDYQLYSSFQYELQDGIHLTLFVNEERLEKMAEEGSMYAGVSDFDTHNVTSIIHAPNDSEYELPEWNNASYSNYSQYASSNITFFAADKSDLAEDEVIVSKYALYYALSDLYVQELNEAAERGDYSTMEQYDGKLRTITELQSGQKEKVDPETGEYDWVELTEEEIAQREATVMGYIKEDAANLVISMKLFNTYDQLQIGDEKTFKVVGVWDVSQNYGDRYLFSDAVAETLWNTQKENLPEYAEYESIYEEPTDAIYGTLYVPYDHSEEQTNAIWDIYKVKDYSEDGSRVTLTSTLISNMAIVDDMITELSKVFLYMGIILAVFAALLLSNLISASISNKTKEIGILRAVGARSADVFKIFFSEAFVITAICILVSTIGSSVSCSLINDTLISLINASLFVFSVPSFIIMVVIALLTAVVATFLPVQKAASKKPVESIRAL